MVLKETLFTVSFRLIVLVSLGATPDKTRGRWNTKYKFLLEASEAGKECYYNLC